MSICNRALFVVAMALLTDCIEEPVASTAIAHPRVIGKVKSISSDDIRTILQLERDGILKEFHSLPSSVTVEVVNHNYVSISFTVRGQSWIERAPVVIRSGLYAPKRSLPSCSVLIQTASMDAEIDCKLQSNSS